jgi:acyl-CoA thioester hydrolase
VNGYALRYSMTDANLYLNPALYKHWIEEHVRFSDLDPLGHVNNNSIGQYFENARAALFMNITPHWPHREQLFILARVAVDFRRELHMPADLRIGTGVLKVGNTSLTLANALFKGDEGIAYCESVSVLINRRTRKPIPITDELRKLLSDFSIT